MNMQKFEHVHAVIKNDSMHMLSFLIGDISDTFEQISQNCQ